jgi:hypothetical protein
VVALTTAAAIDRELTGYDRMARNVSTNAVLLGFDTEGVSQMLKPQLDQRLSLLEVVMAKRDGTLVARVSRSGEISDGWTSLASQASGTVGRSLSVMQETSSGQHFVTLAYPVTDASGETVAVLVCYVNPQRMQDLFGVLPLPVGSVVAVTDANSRVVVEQPRSGSLCWTDAGSGAGESADRAHRA